MRSAPLCPSKRQGGGGYVCAGVGRHGVVRLKPEINRFDRFVKSGLVRCPVVSGGKVVRQPVDEAE